MRESRPACPANRWRNEASSSVGRLVGDQAGRVKRRPPPAGALRGKVEDEPRLRSGSLASERSGAPNYRTVDASLFEAMPQASRDLEAAPWLASAQAHRTIGRWTRASSRQCRRRAETSKRLPGWRAFRRTELSDGGREPLRGNAAGEPRPRSGSLAGVRSYTPTDGRFVAGLRCPNPTIGGSAIVKIFRTSLV